MAMVARCTDRIFTVHTTTFSSRRKLTSRNVNARSQKMYVPSDSFGGLSPERKASQALQSLLTFASAKIILAQLEGSGRGALAAYNQQQYNVLISHLQTTSLSDPHTWLEGLMQQDSALALRVMEVRDAYASSDFEWDQLQQLSIKAIKESNLGLMRKAATASLLLADKGPITPTAVTAGSQPPAAQTAVPEQEPEEHNTAAFQKEQTAQQLIQDPDQSSAVSGVQEEATILQDKQAQQPEQELQEQPGDQDGQQ